MINVFICEDNIEQRTEIFKIIENIIIIENLDMKISLSTKNPYEIINFLSKNEISGLYFLDINLNSKINGIKLAEMIREYDPRGFIVFITTYAEMSYLTFLYKVEALDYIIKDIHHEMKNRIHQCILNAYKKYSLKTSELQKNFIIRSKDKIISIEFDKILFFETSNTIHKVIVNAVDRQVEFYSKMKDIEKLVDNRFYRCHRSFLVNKNNIKEIDIINRTIYMKNGQKCFFSNRLRKGLLE
ncbi:response regulator transcription factor [Clostridium perfringens]|uniref:LytR/AlgR family response regulator transcription factor n=1 Tax=Clostridium perfringens TaxID=1502 RepID=UPI001A236CED|nr:LytTR family DNA-binding domain-containing protein [Clostridium perfringens]MBO3326921.1 response regulator transcription factor [Clostridium perfringens]HAT4356393.1 response regulator transcription factor [Clostridium perfringens]